MPRFELKQSTRHITSHAGLMLIGQCLAAAGLHLIDKLFPVAKGQFRTSDIIKSYLGLLALGKSDFDAIEAFRQDSFFKEALQIEQVPSSAWLRQRMEQLAVDLREETDAFSVHLLKHAKAPITAHGGYVCLDFDTFVMEGSRLKRPFAIGQQRHQEGVCEPDLSGRRWLYPDCGILGQRGLVSGAGVAARQPAQCAGDALLSGTGAAACAGTGAR